MAKRYVFIRMPQEIFLRYKGIKIEMEKDVSRAMGKPIKLTMPKVFRAVADLNENYIQVDLERLAKLAKEKQK